MKPYGIIYIAYCRVTGKVYVGQTIQTLNTRRGKHRYSALVALKKNRLNDAIREHGFENFEFIEVAKAFSKRELDEMEKSVIRMNESDNPEFGYNMSPGGHSPSVEGRRKLALSRRGSVVSPETRLKMSLAAKGRPGFWKGKTRPGLNSRPLTIHRGSDRANTKLVELYVPSIRRAKGVLKATQVADIFGVTPENIHSIWRGQTWKHVTEEVTRYG